MILLRALGLFVVTAVAEIVGCYLPYLWLKKDGSAWLLIPAAASLALFVWLLMLHPAGSGRIYAAYGGVYVAVALVWLWRVDGVPLTAWDVVGVSITLVRLAVVMPLIVGDESQDRGRVIVNYPANDSKCNLRTSRWARLAGCSIASLGRRSYGAEREIRASAMDLSQRGHMRALVDPYHTRTR